MPSLIFFGVTPGAERGDAPATPATAATSVSANAPDSSFTFMKPPGEAENPLSLSGNGICVQRGRVSGRRAAPGNGSLVGAEVAGDHLDVVADHVGDALGDDPAHFEAVHAVADAHDQRHVVLDDEHRRTHLPPHLF